MCVASNCIPCSLAKACLGTHISTTVWALLFISFKCIRTISQSVVSFDHFLAFPIESFIWLLFFSCERFVLVYPWIWIFTVCTLHSKNHFVKWNWSVRKTVDFFHNFNATAFWLHNSGRLQLNFFVLKWIFVF